VQLRQLFLACGLRFGGAIEAVLHLVLWDIVVGKPADGLGCFGSGVLYRIPPMTGTKQRLTIAPLWEGKLQKTATCAKQARATRAMLITQPQSREKGDGRAN
jgi:hypothetical protein